MTMLQQKTADVMIFGSLRLRLSADMSTCEIFYTTQSNNILCFLSSDLILTCLILSSFRLSLSFFLSFFFFLQTIRTEYLNSIFFFSFKCFGMPNFRHRDDRGDVVLNIYHFHLKEV